MLALIISITLTTSVYVLALIIFITLTISVYVSINYLPHNPSILSVPIYDITVAILFTNFY